MRDIKKEVEDNEKVKFSLEIEVCDQKEVIPFETTRRGLEEFKRIMNKPKEVREEVLLEELCEENGNLTFYDGVILLQEIFERIVTDYFDENDKDAFGFRYDLGLIDKMEDILRNEVLNKIENIRKEHLHDLFILNSRIYKRPAWMRNETLKDSSD
ncbi:hypothetical protein MBGDF03_00156 [Thermoplasmatales archaeon SCGC AB-540-F20]|nr:hypothetical protein MBGDF03_00156 [Thermoplasmatales archaeon SCGC AB-540-F20]